jgi:hypothetical protein
MSENTPETGQTADLPKGTVKMTESTLVLLAPTVTGKIDGKTVKATCPHTTWFHSNEKTAAACARKLAADLGLSL